MIVDNQGVRLNVEVTGEGPDVLLIHGWPDTHDMWRAQTEALNDAGFRTITFDLRGFGESDAPADVQAHNLVFHVADVTAVLDALDVGRTHVVGHDWGAALAWLTAAFAPDRVDKLVALSVGNPSAFGSAGLEQREKSWYMLLFQFEGIAEQWLSANGFANFREWSKHPSADIVTARLAEPGVLTSSLNIYRANVHPSVLVEEPMVLPQVQADTMGIWSSGDMALTEAQMTESARFVDGSFRFERIDDVGHWIPLEAPGRVNELLLDFLAP